MTTATRTKKITVAQIHEALLEIAAKFPMHADRRVGDELPLKYIDQGQPNCLVARVLVQLGYSTGVLQLLDMEPRVGDVIRQAAVAIDESRHPALRRITPTGRQLLGYIQSRQDNGEEWGGIVKAAFAPSPAWYPTRLDRKRRPWVYTEE